MMATGGPIDKTTWNWDIFTNQVGDTFTGFFQLFSNWMPSMGHTNSAHDLSNPQTLHFGAPGPRTPSPHPSAAAQQQSHESDHPRARPS